MEGKEKRARIYLDPIMNNLREYYDRDIVKILTKNLKEVFVFWGISSQSFDNILKVLNVSTREEVHFKLLVKYKKEDKQYPIQNFIHLPPFTNNWYLKFDERVRNLKVELVAFNDNGSFYSLLHSAEISTPSPKPSLVVHRDWVKPSWIRYGLVKEHENGEFRLDEEKIEQYFSGTLEVPEGEVLIPVQFTFFDGSSGFLGSSGFIGASNNNFSRMQ